MKFEPNDRCSLQVEDASYDADGSLQVSLRLDADLSTLDELLQTGYVKLSVYDRGDFTDNGTLTLYEPSRC